MKENVPEQTNEDQIRFAPLIPPERKSSMPVDQGQICLSPVWCTMAFQAGLFGECRLTGQLMGNT